MATKKKSDIGSTPEVPLRFEAAAEELESIIDRLEQGDIPLEESLAAYGRGRSLLTRCRSILDAAAAEISETGLDGMEDDADSNA